MNQLYTYYLLLWCKYDMILKAGKFLRNNFFTLQLPDSKNCISWTTCVCLINKIGTVLTKKIPSIKNIQISPPSFWHLTQERFFFIYQMLIPNKCSDENASSRYAKREIIQIVVQENMKYICIVSHVVLRIILH